MKMISLRIKTKKFLFITAIILLAAAIIFAARFMDIKKGIEGDTNQSRINFLNSCGWQVDEQPTEENDIHIPLEFSDVYENYAQMNRQAGFDLNKLKGKDCKQYKYNILNYSGHDDATACIIIYNGKIAGGDVSTPELDGLMIPLKVLAPDCQYDIIESKGED